MDKTKIEWAQSTWNPVRGCLHGCEYCYARKIANRFSAGWENLTEKKLHILDNPLRGLRVDIAKGRIEPYPYGFQPTFHRYRLDEPQKWKKPKTIFVCSMADLFGKWVPDSWIEEVFAACEKAPQHRYLFLTKNPKRYVEYGVPINENIWYGTTITNCADSDRFNYLPAFCNTFVSAEPILGDFAKKANVMFRQINWIIIGAETGNRKDRVIPRKEWIDNICNEADINNVQVFMKDSLIPVVGEENMRRELPWDRAHGKPTKSRNGSTGITRRRRKCKAMIDVKRMQQVSVEPSQLREGDLITVDGIQWVVIKADGGDVVVQQYDHIEDYVFNDDNTNEYEGSDLQEFVTGEYRERFTSELLGDFFILPLEAYKNGGDYPFLQKPENRKRYDSDGFATFYWTSTPYVGLGSYVRSIYPPGSVSSYYANTSGGVAPACKLNLPSVKPRQEGT